MIFKYLYWLYKVNAILYVQIGNEKRRLDKKSVKYNYQI